MTSSINRKYITYHNADRGLLSHGHRGSAQKILFKIGPAVPEICWRTDRLTDWSQYTAPALLGWSNKYSKLSLFILRMDKEETVMLTLMAVTVLTWVTKFLWWRWTWWLVLLIVIRRTKASETWHVPSPSILLAQTLIMLLEICSSLLPQEIIRRGHSTYRSWHSPKLSTFAGTHLTSPRYSCVNRWSSCVVFSLHLCDPGTFLSVFCTGIFHDFSDVAATLSQASFRNLFCTYVNF